MRLIAIDDARASARIACSSAGHWLPAAAGKISKTGLH
jgi:hypothetical protein